MERDSPFFNPIGLSNDESPLDYGCGKSRFYIQRLAVWTKYLRCNRKNIYNLKRLKSGLYLKTVKRSLRVDDCLVRIKNFSRKKLTN